MRYYVDQLGSERPAGERILYCDGGMSGGFREGVDVELSHWIPNHTPEEYRADTSTEICLNFVAAGGLDGDFDLAVNNHADVDGMLSVFVLVTGEEVLEHRHTIAQAAAIGDFSAWGDRPARRLFQAMALCKERMMEQKLPAQDIYTACFERARAVLSGGETPEVEEGLDALDASAALIDGGHVARTQHHERFTHYAVPGSLAERDLDASLRVLLLDRPFSSSVLLWPHARARRDFERVQLLSVEVDAGWYYDLCVPGYTWADTPSLWQPPGLTSTGNSNQHRIAHPPLDEAVRDLSRRETADGEWVLAETLNAFLAAPGRLFPVVLSFQKGGAPAPSALPPPVVAERLASAFPG